MCWVSHSLLRAGAVQRAQARGGKSQSVSCAGRHATAQGVIYKPFERRSFMRAAQLQNKRAANALLLPSNIWRVNMLVTERLYLGRVSRALLAVSGVVG
jgi:hypothetical protein